MRPIDTIILHWSDTPPMNVHVKDIDKWHRFRGFDGIGYHYVITREYNPKVEVGRPLNKIGAHTKGHNLSSIGICVVGGPFAPVLDDQIDVLDKLIYDLIKRFPTIKQVKCHSDYATTECPGPQIIEYRASAGFFDPK